MLAREVLVWEEGICLFSRVATNIGTERFLARLRHLGLDECVQEVESCSDMTRLNGGNAFLVRWRPGTDRGRVLTALNRF